MQIFPYKHVYKKKFFETKRKPKGDWKLLLSTVIWQAKITVWLEF